MKKITFILFLILLALGSALVVSCASSKTQGENDGKITSVGELSVAPGGKVDAPRFLGGVYIKNLVKDGDAGKFPATNLIVFEPKARSAWHSHGGMILLITDGVGYYQEEGKPARILRKGDVFEIPEGVRHWHGASKDSWFSQIVIYDSHWNGAHDDGKIEFVSDSEYENLKEENYSGRAKKRFGSQMFSRAEKGVKLPTFTGTAYVNDLLPDENSVKCPGLHYVVFEPCVINSWHIHEGGQILIATDGTGYHQIEGDQVQVMRPGEVAVCPPGKKHWHGGSSSSTFAHIAANLYPEKKDVQWFDLISDEEYKTIENENSPLVSTKSGLVRGSEKDGILEFLGIPYADAKERFVPAEPVSSWNGILDATEYSKISPQYGILGMGGNDAGPHTDNNCLNLNVWTKNTGSKKPVMVWLHGGGFSNGSANLSEYNGRNLAKSGEAVVVGVNHRLNVFGHLDLSSFGEKYKYSANTGIIDIIDALKWVQNNIENFGGDPDNVTVFGQSGGGAKVLALMTSPYAKGLFHKAINQSGATDNMGVEFQQNSYSRELGELIVKKLGLNSRTVEELQHIDAKKLMDTANEAQDEIAQKYKIPVSIGNGYAMEWEPVIDGDFLPCNPVLEKGFAECGKNIPLLIGTNLNEWTTFMPQTSHPNISEEARNEYEKAYPNENPADAYLVDTLLRLPVLKITAHKADQNGAKVYSYVFTKQDGEKGSYHGAEIPFVFNNLNDELAQKISSLWLSFAKTGVPAVDGVPEWNPYTRKNGAVMILDDKIYLASHHDEKLLHFLVPEYEW